KLAFGIEITDASFKRLLNSFGRAELADILGEIGLNVSGSKDQQIDRLVESLVPASEILDKLPLDVLRDLCRKERVAISGAKNIVITNLLEHYEGNKDLSRLENFEQKNIIPAEPQSREMEKELFSRLLLNLTGQQL